LDQVKVVRNDLTDADLEVVHKRLGKAKDKMPTGKRETDSGKTDIVGTATENR
jgi:hypothetical protein